MEPGQPFLPEHMRRGMELYINEGVEPGSFMMSVLCNDLKEAVGRADHINMRYLTNIVSFCYNDLPHQAWGSPEKVKKWMSQFNKEESADEI